MLCPGGVAPFDAAGALGAYPLAPQRLFGVPLVARPAARAADVWLGALLRSVQGHRAACVAPTRLYSVITALAASAHAAAHSDAALLLQRRAWADGAIRQLLVWVAAAAPRARERARSGGHHSHRPEDAALPRVSRYRDVLRRAARLGMERSDGGRAAARLHPGDSTRRRRRAVGDRAGLARILAPCAARAHGWALRRAQGLANRACGCTASRCA
mmetsp:Transcript_60405/g.179500  ORF Transcript_60405/g.179500 Transcript_60405/m.179500 type:complete len:215 (-) Transcript_60405:629-1273(-)